MACEARTVKLSVIGLSCLQKLISHDAVAPSALKEILSTLKEVTVYGFGIPFPSRILCMDHKMFQWTLCRKFVNVYSEITLI